MHGEIRVLHCRLTVTWCSTLLLLVIVDHVVLSLAVYWMSQLLIKLLRHYWLGLDT